MQYLRCSIVTAALVVAVPLGLAGCSANTARIHQPSKRLARRSGEGITRSQIREAVKRALKRKKWTVEETGTDFITATVKKGENWATAKITMGPGSFAIQHVNSGPSFHYTGDTIHRRYNRWIQRLDAAIVQEVTGIYVLDPEESLEDPEDDLKL